MDLVDYDALFMKKALEQAQLAFEEDEVPIGAIVTCNNKIIGKGYNQTEKLKDVTLTPRIVSRLYNEEFLQATEGKLQ